MTDERNASKLVLRAEALLAGASLREPDFDALASRIDAQLAHAGSTDDTLLLPPLPESVEDGKLDPGAPAQERAAARRTETAESPKAPSSERQGASLAELARAAMARRDAKDAVSLAKESLAIASQQRTNEATSEAVPASAAAVRPRIGTTEPSVVTERERRTLPPSQRSRPAAFDTRGPWLGVAIAAVGLAAGFGLYLAGRGHTTIVEVPVAEVAPKAAATVTATATGEAKVAAAPAAPVVGANSLPAERAAEAPAAAVVAAEALAREPVAPKSTAPAALAEAHAPAAKGSAAASSAGPKPEKIVLEEEHPATRDHDTPGSAKPSASAGLKPAELTTSDGIADRPSTGAAQAAVGAVLGAARSCIAGQPQGSSATLVFGSSGEVSGVSVSGPAEGTPAATCIQAALKKARVQPFAAASFSLAVTIRPP